MKKKLLIICGPTATGKTKVALSLSKLFRGEIISADSRQVYMGMDIGTGKDIPKDSHLRRSKLITPAFSDPFRFWELRERIKIWGYDLSDPKDDFSVALYKEFAGKVIEDVWKREKLPIVVGGTGFYIKALIDGIETLPYPPDTALREKMKGKNADELFEILLKENIHKALKMNESDRKNPVRLIRALEVEKSALSGKKEEGSAKIPYETLLIVGLYTPKNIIDKKIRERVIERLAEGFENEVLSLIKKGTDWNYRSMQGMGYRQYEDYYKKRINREEFIKRWILEEKKYAARQMTWFKKDKRVNWFDVSCEEEIKNVEKAVRNWYYE